MNIIKRVAESPDLTFQATQSGELNCCYSKQLLSHCRAFLLLQLAFKTRLHWTPLRRGGEVEQNREFVLLVILPSLRCLSKELQNQNLFSIIINLNPNCFGGGIGTMRTNSFLSYIPTFTTFIDSDATFTFMIDSRDITSQDMKSTLYNQLLHVCIMNAPYQQYRSRSCSRSTNPRRGSVCDMGLLLCVCVCVCLCVCAGMHACAYVCVCVCVCVLGPDRLIGLPI